MRLFFIATLLLTGQSPGFAQESIKLTDLKESPLESISPAVRESLLPLGYRIQDDPGHSCPGSFTACYQARVADSLVASGAVAHAARTNRQAS
jgi:hypothetical protein